MEDRFNVKTAVTRAVHAPTLPVMGSTMQALQIKQWKQGSTIIREFRALGARMENAKQVARNAGSWWRNSAGLVRITLNNAYFDRLGVPRFS